MFLPNADKREVASRGRKTVHANPSVNRCPQGASGVLPRNLLLTAAVHVHVQWPLGVSPAVQ